MLARGHQLNTVRYSGNDVFLLDMLAPYFSSLRTGKSKPLFIELDTYRYVEHCGPNNDDHLNYRDPKEIDYWRAKDPIALAKHYLIKYEKFPVNYEAVSNIIDKEIEVAFETAKADRAPLPGWDSQYANYYGR